MESLAGIALSSFMVALSGAVMPGPVLTVTISESLRRGSVAGPLIILGHGLLEVTLIAVFVMGFADIVGHPRVVGVLSLTGGAFLLWLSYGMFKDIKNLEIDLTIPRGMSRNPVLAGILTSIANPYWIVWWVTIGLGYVAISLKFGVLGVLLFFIGHISADLGWYSMVSVLVSRGKGRISGTIYRAVIGVCASVMVVFALYFGALGLRHLTA